MKEFFKKIKPLDILIIAIVVSIVFLTSLFIYSSQESKLYLVIKSPKGEWIYPMDINTEINIEGDAGITSIKLENKEAMVTHSPCSNKTCIAAPPIKNLGEWNACLPNKVFLSVESK